MICYSEQLARRYSWLYHGFGWIVPLSVSLIIFFSSSVDRSKEVSILRTEKFGRIQVIFSIVLLAGCALINTICLLRMARRTYRLKHDSVESCSYDSTNKSHSVGSDIRPLINDDDDSDEHTQIHPNRTGDIVVGKFVKKSYSNSLENKLLEGDAQLFRHAILVALLTIDAIIVSSLLLQIIKGMTL